MESKKQKLRRRIEKATELFKRAGGRIKFPEVRVEVNQHTQPLADFMLMENEQSIIF